MDAVVFVWSEGIVRPMINGLVFLYVIFFSNFGLSIIAFTVLVRVATIPLTLKQIRHMRVMGTLQPKLQELREKHGKDSKAMSQETMRMYREAGVSPIGCLGPLVVQLPIWIGLYQALIRTLPTNPDRLVGLSEKLYGWIPLIHEAIPLDSSLFWLNLAQPDPTQIVMPLLVGVSTWVQQKMTTIPASDPRQASTNNMMLWMMPIMLAFFTLGFPSGLALYWITSNLVGVAIQYRITGWEPLFRKSNQSIPNIVEPEAQEEMKEDGGDANQGSFSEDSGRSERGRNSRARRRHRRGGGGSSKSR